jgi:replicative DNA helicase
VESRDRTCVATKSKNCVTGVHELEKAAGGIRPGFVWLVGGDTSVGKSSWLIHVADENLKLGKRVLIVSVEDAPSLYGDRLMQRRARVNAIRLRDGELTPEEHTEVANVVAKAESVPVYLDARGQKAEWVAHHVPRVIDEHGIDLVMFDYIQEFRTGRQYATRTLELEDVSKMLRDSVKTKDRAGIIFSQITITENKARPDRQSIRNCRDIANAAEAILLLWQPKTAITIERKDCEVQVKTGTRCFFVDKIKNGPKGFVIPLSWDDESACFNCSSGGAPVRPDDHDSHSEGIDNQSLAAGDVDDDGYDYAQDYPI